MAVDFMHTLVPATSQRESERRFEAGVRFLQAEQALPESAHAGAWPSLMCRGPRARSDWNAFTTALTATACSSIDLALARCEPLALDALAAMQTDAAHFLRANAAAAPDGSYRFWPAPTSAKPGPDLDDTALVHLALGATDFDDLDALDCLRLFGPYRLTSGCQPHASSSWASSFPGAFGTWMDGNAPIVDVCVNANVLRLLQRCGAERVAGYRAAMAMLTVFVKLRTLPDDTAPYYRSSAMLAWLCAQLDTPVSGALPEETAFAAALDGRLEAPVEPGAPFDELLLLHCARASRGVAPSARDLAQLAELQCEDGGWPPIVVCWNFAGTLCWTSRSFPSALALGLLASELKGDATC